MTTLFKVMEINVIRPASEAGMKEVEIETLESNKGLRIAKRVAVGLAFGLITTGLILTGRLGNMTVKSLFSSSQKQDG